MIRTFLDSGVLLSAARSIVRDRERVLRLLEDPDRAFVTSPFVYLELIPKTVFFKRNLERAFYDEYFRAATWFRDLYRIEAAAKEEACKCGLAAVDALHLAAAHLAGAEEFVTTERPGKPMYRSSLVRVVYAFE